MSLLLLGPSNLNCKQFCKQDGYDNQNNEYRKNKGYRKTISIVLYKQRNPLWGSAEFLVILLKHVAKSVKIPKYWEEPLNGSPCKNWIYIGNVLLQEVKHIMKENMNLYRECSVTGARIYFEL